MTPGAVAGNDRSAISGTTRDCVRRCADLQPRIMASSMTRFLPALVVSACAGIALLAAPQSSPVFRSSVDVMQLDVSVLDKNRQPIRGLKTADFHVSENGEAQPIVDVAEVIVRDRVGAGQVVVIAFDDSHLPRSGPILDRARAIATGVVNRLSGLDIAAAFSTSTGLMEPFGNDADRLRASIAAFAPHRASTLKPSCERDDPTMPSLLTLTRALAEIPQRRKTVFLISTGDPAPFVRPSIGCSSLLAQLATQLFWQAQRANINIHTFDPTGDRPPVATGMPRSRSGDAVGPPAPAPPASLLAPASSVTGRDGTVADRNVGAPNASPDDAVPVVDRPAPRGTGRGMAMTELNSLEVIADSTGGSTASHTTAFTAALDRVFDANRSYYLVSYRTTHVVADGKYRRVDVSVHKSGATTLTRRGYFAPGADATSAVDSSDAIVSA